MMSYKIFQSKNFILKIYFPFLVGIIVLFILSSKFEPFGSSKENMILPMSGSEPHFKPTYWNSSPFVKTNNCYAYFLDDMYTRSKKPQPGDLYLDTNISSRNSSSCSQTITRIQNDNPHIYEVEKNTPCKKGFYKGYLSIDPSRDYHFYRQDSNGLFSHKPGKNPVTKLDASGDLIYDPEISDRNFTLLGYDYNDSCGFLCVPADSTTETKSV